MKGVEKLKGVENLIFEPKRGRRAAGVAFRAEGRSREARAERIHDEASAELNAKAE